MKAMGMEDGGIAMDGWIWEHLVTTLLISRSTNPVALHRCNIDACVFIIVLNFK